MKNVILTHNELVFNLVHSFSEGFQSSFKTYPGYFFAFNFRDKEYTFELWKSATDIATGKTPLNGETKVIVEHSVNKGDYQMNDVRLGVLITHLRDNSLIFTKKVTDFFDGKTIQEI